MLSCTAVHAMCWAEQQYTGCIQMALQCMRLEIEAYCLSEFKGSFPSCVYYWKFLLCVVIALFTASLAVFFAPITTSTAMHAIMHSLLCHSPWLQDLRGLLDINCSVHVWRARMLEYSRARVKFSSMQIACIS